MFKNIANNRFVLLFGALFALLMLLTACGGSTTTLVSRPATPMVIVFTCTPVVQTNGVLTSKVRMVCDHGLQAHMQKGITGGVSLFVQSGLTGATGTYSCVQSKPLVSSSTGSALVPFRCGTWQLLMYKTTRAVVRIYMTHYLGRVLILVHSLAGKTVGVHLTNGYITN